MASARGVAADPVGFGRIAGRASGKSAQARNRAAAEGVTVAHRQRPGVFDPPPPMPWSVDRACGPSTQRLFFGDEDSAGATRRVSEAVAICNRCPVRLDCLQHALDNFEDDGVWGGMAGSARRELRRRATR